MKPTEMDEETDISRVLGPYASARRGSKTKRWIILGLIAAVLLGFGIRWGISNGTPKIQYKTLAANRGALTVLVTATGNLQPTNKVDVSSELSGIIKAVEVNYNDQVKIGQVLARLDSSKLQAQVLQSRAALASTSAKVLQVQATIKEAKDQLERLKRLSGMSNGKAVSKSDIDAAEATLARAKADEAAAKASVDQAKAVLQLNETDLAKTMIRSPVNGIVLVRSAEPGQTVAASLQAPVLFTLAEDLAHMELHVDVDEADVGRVKAGQKANFTVDAYPERNFPAQITQVRFGAKTTSGVVTYETLLDVDNSDLSLRPGMTATADIVVTEVSDALLIPNAALRFSPPEEEKANRPQQGGVLSRIFPRPRASSEKKRPEGTTKTKRQQVWGLRNGQPFSVSIQVGLTDGTRTQVVDGDIQPGMGLIVDTETPGK